MTQRPLLAYQNQLFGLSYIDSFRQDFKHLQTDLIHRGPSRTSLLAPIASTYVAQPPRRSMVTKRPSSKANPRSAGHATSPQNIVRAAPSAPPVPALRSHGSSNSRTASSSVSNMRYSPEPSDESDSYSDCCSDSEYEHETDFSSRATSPDDEYDAGEDERAKRKRQVVDDSMRLFRFAVYKWFVENFSVVCHGEGGRGAKRSADQISGRRSSNPVPSGGTKRQVCDDKGGGVDDEEDSDQEGGNKPGHKKSKPEPRFACPYYKHDPVKYRNHRTCSGPGFKGAHRVKEHLLRRHMMPALFCPKCNAVFSTNAEFWSHSRTSDDCSTRQHDPPDGMNEATVKQLKVRPKSTLTERQKWEAYYHILFPDDDHIPSPYYDDEDEADAANPCQVPEQVSSVARYIKNELFPEARRELELVAERELDGVSERLRNKAFDMIEDAVFRAMRVFHYGREQQGNHFRSSSPSSSPPPSSPRPDSGLATPEPPPPPQLCAPGAWDFTPMFPEANYTLDRSDFATWSGSETLFHGIPMLGARSDIDGCASASNYDSTYGTVGDEVPPTPLPYDLPAFGF